MQNFVTRAVTLNTSLLRESCRALIGSIGSTRSYLDDINDNETKLSGWMSLNEKVYPPQDPSEPRRPAFVCYEVKNFKYSPKKMWYVACFIRGMSVDEARKQLSCIKSKGAILAKDAIDKAIEMAVNEHNVEFRSNLWVAESFCGKGVTIKGLRRGAKGRISIIRYRHSNYYLRLEEGQPPEDYYCKKHLETGTYQLGKWFDFIRNRKIVRSL